jgi:F-type H+-transporting ATPase subunit gamma
MANTRELRRRIRSIKNISQITKAMQMVAATKMRRAQNQALSGRPYNLNLNQAIYRLLTKTDIEGQPLVEENESTKVGVILLSTDKGLAGSLNTNIFRALVDFSKEKTNLVFYTIGRKGRQFVVKTSKELQADFENPEAVTFRQAKQLARLITGEFLAKNLKEVYLVYPDFVSTLRQEPRVVKILPVDPKDESFALSLGLDNTMENRHSGERSDARIKSSKDSGQSQNDKEEFIFEPDPSALLNYVLNHYIETKIYQALLETKASEHSARMIAMQNATDNAKDLVSDLTLSYNQTRQDAITKELLEITTAQAALE